MTLNDMYKRKIVKQGASTLMISLPIKWTKPHNLKKGDEITLQPINHNLLVSCGEKEVTKKATTIHLPNLLESAIRTLIANTYKKGYDHITVHFKTAQQFELLKNVIQTQILGFDITTKSKDKCIVENITEPLPEQFDIFLRKIFFNITTLFETTIQRLSSPKTNTNDSDYEDTENLIQKYDNFCRRVITKEKFENNNTEYRWNFLSHIINAQREIYLLNKLISTSTKVSQQTIAFLKEAQDFSTQIQQIYLKKDVNNIGTIHIIEKKLLYTKGYHLLDEKRKEEDMIIYHIMSAIRQLYHTNNPLLGLLL